MKKLLALMAMMSLGVQAADYPAACVEVDELTVQLFDKNPVPNMSLDDLKASQKQAREMFGTLSADEQKQMEEICKMSLEAMKAMK